MDEKPYPPTVTELFTALWIAGCAQEVVEGIIEKGRPPADRFIELCHCLHDLESCLRLFAKDEPATAAGRFYWRADEIHSASRPDESGFSQLTSDCQDRILDLKFDSQKSEPRE
jgi:hypothetical protein